MMAITCFIKINPSANFWLTTKIWSTCIVDPGFVVLATLVKSCEIRLPTKICLEGHHPIWGFGQSLILQYTVCFMALPHRNFGSWPACNIACTLLRGVW
jgi:hypothetical protein